MASSVVPHFLTVGEMGVEDYILVLFLKKLLCDIFDSSL